MKKLIYLLIIFFSTLTTLTAQVITWEPLFVTSEDTITIIFDATEGNGELAGATPPIYAHTGVITDMSTNPNDWRYVQGDWGTADANVLMQSLGGDKYQIKYHIRSYYGVPLGEEITHLAFVFRNTNGSKVGRATDGSDIFLPLSQPGLSATFSAPTDLPYFAELGETFAVKVEAVAADNIELFVDNVSVASSATSPLNYNLTVSDTDPKWVKYVVSNDTESVADSFFCVVNEVTVLPLPTGIQDGINYINDETVVLSLYAPQKEFIYVIGDFTNWQIQPDYLMNRSTDGIRHWLEISGLEPGVEYGFQYFVEGILKIGDPYSEKILDGWNDGDIPESVYPDLKPYPAGQTSGMVSVLETGQTPYDWQTPTYDKVPKEDLVIYELLVRDFVGTHSYETLIDTLDYLENLGINAIELMPIMEFEGNESWGYNPMYHLAPDKYYGTREALKAFIDECHSRGIMVILDMVLNHAFGQSPLVQLYWTGTQPSANSPWFNQEATHPFNVGFDFNHESTATKLFVDRVNTFWLEEYKFDGFRFDLSKGFTQTNNPTNVTAWGIYDASRITLLKRMADVVWETDPEAYVILEHFAANGEETELSEYGMMTWGNAVHNYNEATMGYLGGSNFDWISYQERGWDNPHVVGYMESHDEERLMFKNTQFGNSSGTYDVKELETGLARNGMAAAFFFTIPGPKMVWQFGELGYDVSIDDPCRVCNKPILWEYWDEPARRELYNTYRSLIHLKTEYNTFRTDDFQLSLSGAAKRIQLNHDDMNAIVMGNFDVVPTSVTPNFSHTGIWYDYFTGEELNITNASISYTYAPGEYHIYTDEPLPLPDFPTAVEDLPFTVENGVTAYPNPFTEQVILSYELQQPANVHIEIFNLAGQKVTDLLQEYQTTGFQKAVWNGTNANGQPVAAGQYLYRLQVGEAVFNGKMVKF